MVVVFNRILLGKAEEKHEFLVFSLPRLTMDTETFVI
jgi:hypothetical protein